MVLLFTFLWTFNTWCLSLMSMAARSKFTSKPISGRSARWVGPVHTCNSAHPSPQRTHTVHGSSSPSFQACISLSQLGPHVGCSLSGLQGYFISTSGCGQCCSEKNDSQGHLSEAASPRKMGTKDLLFTKELCSTYWALLCSSPFHQAHIMGSLWCPGLLAIGNL